MVSPLSLCLSLCLSFSLSVSLSLSLSLSFPLSLFPSLSLPLPLSLSLPSLPPFSSSLPLSPLSPSLLFLPPSVPPLSLPPSIDNLVPGPITNIIALPDSITSLFIQWLPPKLSYVNNPLLLQYTLYYSTSIDINYTNTNLSKSGLTTGSDGMGTYTLTGLRIGIPYYLALRAENNAGLGAEPLSVTLSTTYGTGMLIHFM